MKKKQSNKKTSYFKNYSLGLCLLATLLFSCDNNNNNNNNNNIPEVDKALLIEIKKSMDEFDKNEIWDGYDFSKYPLYLVFINRPFGEKNTTIRASRGYIINPPKNISGTIKVGATDIGGLNAYIYNKDINRAQDSLEKGNGLFDFYFKIESTPHLTVLYTDKKSEENELLPYTQLITHEAFHIFQHKNWAAPSHAIQDRDNYPLNKDLVALQLLTLEIAKKMPSETNKRNVLNYLKMYVAIRSKEIEIDPTASKLVKNMANEQEKIEGTARYIEFMNATKVIPGFKPTSFAHQTEESTSIIKDRLTFRIFFTFGIWYNTGAMAVHMLKNQGVNVAADLKTDTTLYDIAKRYLNLSIQEQNTALQNAKDQFNWVTIEEEAIRLTNLQ